MSTETAISQPGDGASRAASSPTERRTDGARAGRVKKRSISSNSFTGRIIGVPEVFKAKRRAAEGLASAGTSTGCDAALDPWKATATAGGRVSAMSICPWQKKFPHTLANPAADLRH